MLVDVLALFALAAWLGVLLLPSGPWRTRERFTLQAIPNDPVATFDLSCVTVLIPARNEAGAIGRTLEGLAEQGENLEVIVVDDQSDDDTAAAASEANSGLGLPLNLRIIDGQTLPPGWGGKLWALEQGFEWVERDYCLLLDAEIVLAPRVLGALIKKAEDEDRAMISIMAKLHCKTFWEKLLVPPFIFFFKLLYPFAKVNDSNSRTAAAAGGCILIRTDVLRAIGRFAAIRDALIDDCILAARVKLAGHSIWLGLSEEVLSLRAYTDFASFRRMVTRTAFTQLRYSVGLLGLVIAIMSVIFVAPIAGLGFAAGPWGTVAGAGALSAMLVAFSPTVRFYRLSWGWVLTLPGAAMLFLVMTLESAVKYWCGIKAQWKGRTYTKQP